jgi:hypothetical protein
LEDPKWDWRMVWSRISGPWVCDYDETRLTETYKEAYSSDRAVKPMMTRKSDNDDKEERQHERTGYWHHFPGGMMLTIHIHQGPRIRKLGSMPLSSLTSAWQNLHYFKNIVWGPQGTKKMMTVGTFALYLNLYPGFAFSVQAGSIG